MTNGRILCKKYITLPPNYQVSQGNKIKNIMNGILLGKILLLGSFVEKFGKQKSSSFFEDKLYNNTEKDPHFPLFCH